MSSSNAVKDSNSTQFSKYPEPLVVKPIGEHKQTFIVLHGRGSIAQKFAEPFLSHPISPLPNVEPPSVSLTIRSCFPHAKFVFPTASLRRAAIYRRSLTHQWFDNWSLDRPEYRQELQIEGLGETSAFIHSLLQKEIDDVGAGNVILVGLSQGCAASLISLLTWQGEPIAAAVGMCGWLPLRRRMAQSAQDTNCTDEDDPFEHSEDENPFDDEGLVSNSESGKLGQVVDWLRDELEMDPDTTFREVPFQRIPVFLGHGTEDEKVSCELGRRAASFLGDLGVDLHWNEYKGLGHWYSGDMLRDIVAFLNSLEGWKVDSYNVTKAL